MTENQARLLTFRHKPSVQIVRRLASGLFFCRWDGGELAGEPICRDIPAHELKPYSGEPIPL